MEETNALLQGSFEDFLKPDENQVEEKEDTLETRFATERMEWTVKIKDMSHQLKKLDTIAELQVNIYTERQRAVEYYHYLNSLFIKMNSMYRLKYAEKYDFYTTKSQIRYPNESTKVNKILTEMKDIVLKKEKLDNMMKYMSSTIATIDNLIYGIKYRIEVQNILTGTK
jgi:hypothetical protein